MKPSKTPKYKNLAREFSLAESIRQIPTTSRLRLVAFGKHTDAPFDGGDGVEGGADDLCSVAEAVGDEDADCCQCVGWERF